MENGGISWGMKRVKMKVSFEVERGEKWIFQQSFSLWNQQNFRVWKRKQQWRLNQGHDVSMSLQEITFLAIKIVLEGFKNDLATFWYNKFYRWLTVAPLGDGVFLKASRTSDFHFLGGWLVPYPLGCFSLLGWSSFFSENIINHEKQWISIQQAFYLPNPTDLTFFLL